MLCQRCGQNEASRHFKTTVNGETRSTYLCSACASMTSSGAGFSGVPFDFDLPALMSEILGLRSQRPGGTCPDCGMGMDELSKYGRTGCVGCYRYFAPALAPYVRRVHGDANHTGRIPAGVAPVMARRRRIEELKGKLQEAVQEQAFEHAAELRDEIASLQAEEGNK